MFFFFLFLMYRNNKLTIDGLSSRLMVSSRHISVTCYHHRCRWWSAVAWRLLMCRFGCGVGDTQRGYDAWIYRVSCWNWSTQSLSNLGVFDVLLFLWRWRLLLGTYWTICSLGFIDLQLGMYSMVPPNLGTEVFDTVCPNWLGFFQLDDIRSWVQLGDKYFT